MRLKLLRKDDGYSFYENPDAELVEKIKNHPKPTSISNVGIFRNEDVWTYKETLKNGKVLIESVDGDIQTITKEEYDDYMLDAHLENINRTYLISDTFNKYFAPYTIGNMTVLSMTDEYLVNPFRTESFYSGVNGVFNTEGWSSYGSLNGSWNCYADIEITSPNGSGHIYFNADGEIVNRDYNLDFNVEPETESQTKEETVDYFISMLMKKLPEVMQLGREIYYCDDFAMTISEEHTWYRNKLSCRFFIARGNGVYYEDGNSRNKLKLPKKDVTQVSKEEIINQLRERARALLVKHVRPVEEVE
jgi:hypothetical protein